MRIDILTLFPEMFHGIINSSILKRSREKGKAEINIINIRDYTTDKHKKADDYPYGGEAGMVLMIEPVFNALTDLKKQREYDEIIYTSPDGDLFDQRTANSMSMLKNIIILCGHYKGVDQRIRDHLVTKEISIGNYVLSGGELAAAVITDGLIRLIPGVISDETSALSDSFQDGLISPPVYTRPYEFKGWKVPDVLLSGNAKEIDNWKMEKSLENTKNKRPEILE